MQQEFVPDGHQGVPVSLSTSQGDSRRDSRRASRTTNACQACKGRKSKCSGPPGPCTACAKFDSFCHFNPKLDTRRKCSYKPPAIDERRRYILEGLLHALKHNESDDVQNLLSAIRGPTAPEELAGLLKENLLRVQKRGFIAPLDVDEPDLLTLGLQGLFEHRDKRLRTSHSPGPTPEGSWTFEPASPDTSSSPVSRAQPALKATSLSSTKIPATLPDLEEAVTRLLDEPDAGACWTSPDWSPDSTDGLTFPPSYSTTTISHGSTTTNPTSSDVSSQTTAPSSSSSWPREYHNKSRRASVTQPYNSDTMNHWQHTSSSSPLSTTTALRYAYPATPAVVSLPPSNSLSRSCYRFMDTSWNMMKSGVSLDQIKAGDQVEVEVLFRDRRPSDETNIANWASETVRHMPPMHFSTRLATVLAMARLMPYMIAPSQTTWDDTPGMLRPTRMQAELPHDIGLNFLPIPILRDILIYRPGDWFAPLYKYGYKPNWLGGWGDVDESIMTDQGGWNDTPFSERNRSHVSSPTMAQPLLQAIVRDPSTGKRVISREYEKWCWQFDRWSVAPGVLSLWPDLAGHIALHR